MVGTHSDTEATGTHQETESNPWTVNIVDHPMRTESKWFRNAKKVTHAILLTLPDFFYGAGSGPGKT